MISSPFENKMGRCGKRNLTKNASINHTDNLPLTGLVFGIVLYFPVFTKAQYTWNISEDSLKLWRLDGGKGFHVSYKYSSRGLLEE